MPSLTIDGRRVELRGGETILAAARRAGIEIPTLCHVDGLPPSTSCFLCAVQVHGRPTLSPACAMPAADGMVVATDSEDIRASRKMALELVLSDHIGDCVAPCRATCPAGLDGPAFIACMARGEHRRAAEIVSEGLVLPASLGRICPRPCEAACRRRDLDGSLSIGALHRFCADRDLASGSPYVPAREGPTGRRVGIVGAGPAGLAAAYHLLVRGHAVEIFDAHALPGGMLRYGVPAFRLPREVLDGEIAVVRALGAELRMGLKLGRDVRLDDLRRDFHAVFVALGAQGSRGLGIPGEELALPAADLLERTAEGRPPELGGEVVVLGGGSVAMDSSRTAVRLGARSVVVFYRRSRREMPCLPAEVEAAEAEGVRVEPSVAPVRLERRGSGRLLLTYVRTEPGEPDASGRRRPVPVPGSETAIEATCVVAAVGQSVETDGVLDCDCLRPSGDGIAVDPRTLATSIEGVFAGGDAVTGPDLAVRAVGAGKLAAASIDQHLRGLKVVGDPGLLNVLMGRLDGAQFAALFPGAARSPQAAMPELVPGPRRASFDEVELGLAEAEAVRDAARCLGCGCARALDCRLRVEATRHGADLARFRGERRPPWRDATHPLVVYEPGKCILCGACVRAAEEAREPVGLSFTGRGFEPAVAPCLGAAMAEGLAAAAPRAAQVCPTGALALRSGARGGCRQG
ncbi:MAG: FAD-dependent oxidoreductase [Planctomycetes bacterium]|nr:FAD-dependent oxidoreductase [Planctomycetota bacterium]